MPITVAYTGRSRFTSQQAGVGRAQSCDVTVKVGVVKFNLKLLLYLYLSNDGLSDLLLIFQHTHLLIYLFSSISLDGLVNAHIFARTCRDGP